MLLLACGGGAVELPGLQRRRDGKMVADEAEESSGAEGEAEPSGRAQEGEEGMDMAGGPGLKEKKRSGKGRGKGALVVKRRKPVLLKSIPIPQTISVKGGDLLVDPTGEEERLWGGNNTVTLVFDSATLQGDPKMVGLFKAGGPSPMSLVRLQVCARRGFRCKRNGAVLIG